jgi:hypothetical protein
VRTIHSCESLSFTMSDSSTYSWNATLMEWDPSLPLVFDMECACKNLSNFTVDPCFTGHGTGMSTLGLHIGSIFIILGIACFCHGFAHIVAASLLGVILPIFIAIIPGSPTSLRKILYYGKFFGSGVILATGYVTLLFSPSVLSF